MTAPTPASVSPDVDTYLATLDALRRHDVDNDALADVFHILSETHAYATCGPDDIRHILTQLRAAVDKADALAAEHLPVTESADNLEVEVTGYVNTLPSGMTLLRGNVRGGDLPNEVTFTVDRAEADGLLGALAAGETVTVDLYTDQVLGR